MKKNNLWLGILAITLIFGITVVGCDNGSTDGHTGGGFSYTEEENTITITRYTGAGGRVTIPAQINGKPVTGIGDYAFKYHTSLTNITIPDSVSTIGKQAFANCLNLTGVTIPNRVISIGEWAFFYCNNLASITIPDSVISIGWGAFAHCHSLASVTIRNNVTSIGREAFSGCTGLTGITIYFLV